MESCDLKILFEVLEDGRGWFEAVDFELGLFLATKMEK